MDYYFYAAFVRGLIEEILVATSTNFLDLGLILLFYNVQRNKVY